MLDKLRSMMIQGKDTKHGMFLTLGSGDSHHVSKRHVTPWQSLTFEPSVRNMSCLVSFPWIMMDLSLSSMVPHL